METVGKSWAVAGQGRRAGRSAAALLVGGALLLGTAACNDGGGATGSTDAKGSASAGSSSSTDAAPKVSAAQLTVTPADGATDVQPKDGLQVAVAGGKLTTVEVTDKNGKAVDGSISADGLSWKPAGQLTVGTTYTVAAQAVDPAGLVAASTTSFTTLTPAKTASTNDNIADNGNYGVGMIVSVRFGKAIKNKDAVLGGVTVTGSDGTVAKGHWFGDSRLDFRPENFWTPGTKVTVKYRLKNVEVAPGVYGDIDKDEPFTIGRYQVSTVDAAAHTMTVDRGSGKTETVPITAGNDQNASWNGTMVISSKEKVTRMNSATVSNVKGDEYDVPDVPHAMRLTTSGTYVHGNYWSSAFGKSNASHGCIGVADAKGGSDSSAAGKFFNSSIVGDVVRIKNSKGQTVSGDNGWSGWTIPWSKW
ncbi:Ig-like domain-containing protein [Kitasatospora sp. YST-16]|uniref:L,D-transpeptidase n=1 Tax=Kitasatospora sp. YST-16 TaxID=2998080 RepID=UPI0022852578|nr:Ig-like domain-containing protein [Kitasatospora sp. YST-16]WAL73915.1 Ig-like domain-containing protein [Kitasatospora sp. YST-16]WNW39989.1 Ig-like domain-containing protein [Streptomyces sp. Li-HN-5-13]